MKQYFIQTYPNNNTNVVYRNIIEIGFEAETEIEKCLLAALQSSRKSVTISGDKIFVTLESK